MLPPRHFREEQLRQLGEEKAARQAAQDGDEGGEKGLPGEDAAEIALVHAQDVVEAEFPVAPPGQKGIGVEHKQQGEYGDDDGAQQKDHRHGVAAPHIAHHRGIGQAVQDVEHHHHAPAGQEIGQVQPLVLPHPVQGQAEIKALLHLASPPVARIVRVSEIF